ncbi:MAG: DNA double-strand break repair nuclease NurA [Candidatus Viridilinea halotolerans]|uniref:DNA double-strand break repair nuclease NurA n=1 Tax=Candidatus Viridilinea halotolerans TaxID=2491704 RepID=A0A426TRY0_9CHLR|nr:MAG: DNA double-strand break repair nuclease NurA [Candidatus Viridilinea halotolerans]
MGLDLAALGRQVRQMSHTAAADAADTATRAAAMRERMLAAAGEEEHWGQAVALSRETAAWLLAHPVEPLGTVIDLPPPPPAYTIVATDGSQIELDRHGAIACYVINIGQVFLRYGQQPTARLTSQPLLCYREEDLYLHDGVRRIPIEGNYLSARRDVDEGVALAALAAEHLDGSLPAVALQDGTLVRWTLAGAERVVQDHFMGPYLDYLEQMRVRGIAVASYISRPRSPELVGTIRLMLCPDVDVAAGRGARCERCSDERAGRTPSCQPCQGLVDSDLFGARLSEGQRGPLLLSMSRINIERYGPHQIHFFYLRVGRELCRIELPQWVAQRPEQVNLVHSLVYDQCARGGGYPVALERAHEQAIVRSADRRAFQRLLESSLYRAEAPGGVSAKRESKEFSRG